MANKNKYINSFRIVLILILLCSLLSAQEINQLSQDEFDAQLIQAYAASNDQEINNLIRNNRFLTKPFVDKILTESIQSDLNGKNSEAKDKFLLAKRVASLFHNIHHEKSLSNAVGYVSHWTEAQKEQKLIADSLFALGTRYRGKKTTRDQALEYYQQTLKIYKELGDKRGEGDTYGGMGFIYWYKRDPEKMLENFQMALDARIDCDDKKGIGNSYSDIGYFVQSYFYKDHVTALQNLTKSEKIRREIGDWTNVGKTYSKIARVQESMGNLQEAFNYYSNAAEVHGKLNEKKLEATALNKCAVMQKELGKYLESLNYLERSLVIRNELGNYKDIAFTLSEVGNIYRHLGEYELAYANYNKMLTLMENAGDEDGIASSSNNMGLLMSSLGHHEKAIDNFSRSLEIWKKLDDKDGIAVSLGNLGIAYYDLMRYEEAEKYYTEALQLARDVNNLTAETNNLINLGNVQNILGKFDEALDNYQEGLKLARRLNNPEQIWMNLLGIGDNHEKRGEYNKAMDHYNQALEILESMRGTLQTAQYKSSFFAISRYIYDAVVHLLCMLHSEDKEKGYDIQAFHYAERAKARAFLDLMSESLANVRTGADEDLLIHQEKILSQLSHLEQDLNKLSFNEPEDNQAINELKKEISVTEDAYQKLKNTIRERNPAYSDLQYPEPITLSKLQTLIPDDNTTVLTYFIGDSSSVLWAVKKSSHQTHILPARKSLQDQIEVIRFSLSNPGVSNPASFAKASIKLYDQLVRPAEDIIRTNDELVIIPDGLLHYLPFEVLLSKSIKSDEINSYSDFPYLIRKNPISYCPSSSILSGLIETRKNRNSSYNKYLLAFGDPVFSDTEKLLPAGAAFSRDEQGNINPGVLERLKYSGEEVENIAELFDEDAVTLYKREFASEKKVKESIKSTKYQYVHFATHGLINERQPDFSSIVFAQDEESNEDGLLQAAEIFNLRINSDLVVLSACQTGLGKMVRGEGMIGLSRAFMYAGSPSVMVSLWRVSDRSTSELIQQFYENLVEDDLNKSKALQQAQIEMIEDEDFAHPFYWAPFILIGDWE